mmetsp:Transcript_81626/g.132312  ORF Transcript_81626/g.132312 Transcript_81626/m.132312 type:complete len:227 (+) Transcript_81626:317-997(+)
MPMNNDNPNSRRKITMQSITFQKKAGKGSDIIPRQSGQLSISLQQVLHTHTCPHDRTIIHAKSGPVSTHPAHSLLSVSQRLCFLVHNFKLGNDICDFGTANTTKFEVAIRNAVQYNGNTSMHVTRKMQWMTQPKVPIFKGNYTVQSTTTLFRRMQEMTLTLPADTEDTCGVLYNTCCTHTHARTAEASSTPHQTLFQSTRHIPDYRSRDTGVLAPLFLGAQLRARE